MIASMDDIRKETDKLDQELEEAHGEFDKTKAVLEKKIALYSRYENSDRLTRMNRLEVQNKKNWYMAHLLGLIEHEDMVNKISDLTKRVYELEKQQQANTARLEENQ
jgi:hypothetical protein